MDRSALARKPMTELKDIAAHLEMRGYQKLRKADLIDAIVQSGDSGNGAAPAADRGEASDEGARKVLPPPAREDAQNTGRNGRAQPEPLKEDGTAGDARDRPDDSGRGRSEKLDGKQSAPEPAPRQSKNGSDAGDSTNVGSTEADNDNDDGDGDGDGDGDDAISRKRRNRRDRRKRNRDRGSDDNDSARSGGGTDGNAPGEVRAGVLDILPEGYGFLRTTGYLPGERDVYVSQGQIRKHGLRRGDVVQGPIREQRSNEKVPALHHVEKVNGEELQDGQVADRESFDELPVRPAETRIDLSDSGSLTARLVDLTAPIAEGQRTFILSPPRADGGALLRELMHSIAAVRPDSHLMSVWIDAPAEEVAAVAAVGIGEVISSTFDQPAEEHIGVAELAIERARRLVELGHDVVVVLHSLTRLARAYGVNAGNSHKVIAPNVDASSLYPPKRFMASARNVDDGGSLTILATLLTDTASAHDDVIAAEFGRVGNSVIALDQELALRQMSPPLLLRQSYNRDEASLHDGQIRTQRDRFRAGLTDLSAGEALERVMEKLSQTSSNHEFIEQFEASDLTENR